MKTEIELETPEEFYSLFLLAKVHEIKQEREY